MNKHHVLISAIIIVAVTAAFTTFMNELWTPAQLESPEALAMLISNVKVKPPMIVSVGPGALIKGSVDVGPAKDSANLKKLKLLLGPIPRDADIVIYCGCCPFEHCPNIRPAFDLLNQMNFTHQRLLNIEHNIKTDWISKGYPVAKMN